MADMIETDAARATYELAYHLVPDLEEEAAKTRAREIEAVIAKYQGTVVTSRDPKRTHLSYPIKRNHYGLFGVADFSALADSIAPLQAALKLEEGVLRFMIIRKPEEGKEVRTLGEVRARKPRAQAVQATMKKMKEEGLVQKKEAAPEEQKQMEEDLEEVLGKI